MSVPPCPPVFAFDQAPVGVEVKFCSFWQKRPLLDHGGKARMIVVHTNAARGEGSLDSASNWTERNVGPDGMYGGGTTAYTIPHYQVDRDGRARKILPSNLRGIANSTGDSVEHENKLASPGKADASWHALAIETADTGTDKDPSISDFTPAQAETVAAVIAYESIVHGFPIELADAWWGHGVCSHTDPFPYPYLTTVRGKPCPGAKKKASVRNLIIPRARQIAAAWTATPEPAPVPPSTLEDDPMFIARDATTGKMWLGNLISKVQVDDVTAQHRIAFAQRAGRPILNTDGKPVLWEHKLSTVLAVSDAQIRALGGVPV